MRVAGAESLIGSSIEELIGAIQSADCVISVDTGTMHLGAALGTPVIALFGPSNAARTAPYALSTPVRVLASGVDCQPCFGTSAYKQCAFNRCMQELTPQTVLNACHDLTGL